jgi:hypothetical protein
MNFQKRLKKGPEKTLNMLIEEDKLIQAERDIVL